MELEIVFWFVFLWSLVGLFATFAWSRGGGKSWIVLYIIIAVTAGFGKTQQKPALIYAAAAAWLLFVLTPALLMKLCGQLSLQQRYTSAYRMARVVQWLHPFGSSKDLPVSLRALHLAQQGDFAAAREILGRLQDNHSSTGLAATINCYRINGQWEELAAWSRQNQFVLNQHSQFVAALMRGCGETGDLRGMADLYEQNRERIAKTIPGPSHDLCRLVLFAFGGRRDWVTRLFAGNLAALPEPIQKFWLATADLAAGLTDSARAEFEALRLEADPPLKLEIDRRLSNSLVTTRDEWVERIIQTAGVEQGHEETFGARPKLFSRKALATQMLIIVNVAMFWVEMRSGGSEQSDVLYQLGALVPYAVHAGEWWRLAASTFLHFGPLHLGMNMLGLWVLGPFVEFALGFRRFLTVYLAAGIGSMAMVLALASGRHGFQMTVGASGSIMGLVGATGALMWRGWRRERALTAKRRLSRVLFIIVSQTIFDAAIPEVSMTAHLSGAVLGFLFTLLLRDRLQSSTASSEQVV